MAARVPAPVRKLVDRASVVAALLTGLAIVLLLGQPVVPVVTFAAGAVLAYGSFQYGMAQALRRKRSRRRPVRR
ncbi:hypothetical protein ABZ667_39085 [Streptomyces lavendulae]|uniref:hypothetical protein n=1 Tax=Streptomyces lavendulae TaxID=1914 RepID=UPI0033EF166F